MEQITAQDLETVAKMVAFAVGMLLVYKFVYKPFREGCLGIEKKPSEDMVQKEKVNDYVKKVGKSRLTSFVLTILLGPLGILYSSVGAGIVMLIIGTLIAMAIPIIGLFFVWFLSIALGDHFTYKYNQKIIAQAEFMQKN